MRQVKPATSELLSWSGSPRLAVERSPFQGRVGIRHGKVQKVKKWKAGHTGVLDFNDIQRALLKTAPDTWFLGFQQLPAKEPIVLSGSWQKTGGAWAGPARKGDSELVYAPSFLPRFRPSPQRAPAPHWSTSFPVVLRFTFSRIIYSAVMKSECSYLPHTSYYFLNLYSFVQNTVTATRPR